jgi:hypothetical protein
VATQASHRSASGRRLLFALYMFIEALWHRLDAIYEQLTRNEDMEALRRFGDWLRPCMEEVELWEDWLCRNS